MELKIKPTKLVGYRSLNYKVLRMTENLKNKNGQVIVIVALLLVVLFGIVAFVVDVGLLYQTRRELQTTADAAALAGAQDLTDAVSAKSTAIYYAELHGVQPSDTTPTTPYDGDPLKIEVVCKGIATFTFARVLGFTESEVSARAVAIQRDIAGVAIFHGGDEELILNGPDIDVIGGVHSNGNFKANGENISISGITEAVGEIMEDGENINIPSTLSSPVVYIPLAEYTLGIGLDPGLVDTEESSAQEYSGDLTIDIDLNENIYVHGKVEIKSSFTGSIIADDDIYIDEENIELISPVIYSKNGKIEVKKGDIIIEGTLYSPNSEVIINNSPGNVTIYGRIVANFVRLNGPGITVDNSDHESKWFINLLIE